MKGQKAIFCGDIGCYTLGNAQPLDMVDTCLCMGADVTIAQGGADVVVSAKLTEQAFRFTVESSNLGYDNIPSFRLIFREHHNDLDGRE